MKPRSPSKWSGSALVAIGISLVVNFSYLLVLFDDQPDDRARRWERDHAQDTVVIPGTGVLRIHPDGYGYLHYPAAADQDSIYVTSYRIFRLGLHGGDSLEVAAVPPARPAGHWVMHELRTRNGAPFDYSTLYDRPSDSYEMAMQLAAYAVLAFLLIVILTLEFRRRSAWITAGRYALSLAATTAFYFVMLGWSPAPPHGSIDLFSLLKCSFTLVVAVLYGRIYELLYQRQMMALENERLRSEMLSTRYDMLVSQINPHFLFNSLNSLAMLVRDGQRESALRYIDRLSYTFRYILQSGQSALGSLAEELDFVAAYRYLLEIRYADKLFFDVRVEERMLSWRLPLLSLQPLVENAVKHNTITRQRPLTVSIRTEGEWLVVENPLQPKIGPEPGTGIGLKNLGSRYELATGRGIVVERRDERFLVRLPLLPPQKTTVRS